MDSITIPVTCDCGRSYEPSIDQLKLNNKIACACGTTFVVDLGHTAEIFDGLNRAIDRFGQPSAAPSSTRRNPPMTSIATEIGKGLINSIHERRVTHVRLSSGSLGKIPGYEHIVELKGPGWTASRDDVASDLGTKRYRYYTDEDGGPRAYLEVMDPPSLLGSRFVRTQPDCTVANNLLSLPRF